MKLDPLGKELFWRVEPTAATTALGGLAAPAEATGGTWSMCYCFFADGTYVLEPDNPDTDS